MRRRKTAVLLVLTALLAAGFLLWGNCSLRLAITLDKSFLKLMISNSLVEKIN